MSPDDADTTGTSEVSEMPAIEAETKEKRSFMDRMAFLGKSGESMERVPLINKVPKPLRIVVVLLVVLLILVAVVAAVSWPSGDEPAPQNNIIDPAKLEETSDTIQIPTSYLDEFNEHGYVLGGLIGENATLFIEEVIVSITWQDEPDQRQLGRERINEPDNFQLEVNIGQDENWTVQSEIVGNDPSTKQGSLELSVDITSLVNGYVYVGNITDKYIPDSVIYPSDINIVVYLHEAEDLYASGPALLKWNDFGNEYNLAISYNGLIVPD